MSFSPELVARIKKYFKENYAKDLTEEEANQYLKSSADLYLHVAKNQEEKDN
jgi:hypothetical protein